MFLRRKCVRLAATLPPVRRKHDRDAATLPPVRCKRVCNAATVCRLCVANAVATQRLCLTGTLTDPLSWFAITLLRTNKPETRRNVGRNFRRYFRRNYFYIRTVHLVDHQMG